MKTFSLLVSLFLASMAVACTAETSSTPASTGTSDQKSTGDDAGACTPIADSATTGVGLANPAAVYCQALGYALTDETCAFPDGTSCEQWAFYRGECGGAHSFCNLHGGAVSNKVEDMGGWTASYALCTQPDGKTCEDSAFAKSCTCE